MKYYILFNFKNYYKNKMELKSILPFLDVFNLIITIFLNLSPIVVFIPVIKGKEKYTNIPISMLIFNLLNNLCWACYWFRLSYFNSLLCCSICSTIATLFFILYLYFLNKKQINKFIISIIFLFCIELIIIYISIYVIKNLNFYGKYLIVINIIMYIAPGQNIIKVIKENNYKYIPIVNVIMGALCSGGWFLYGKIMNDINCMIPNGLGLLFSLINTIILLFYYLKARNKKNKSKFYPVENQNNQTRDVEIK